VQQAYSPAHAFTTLCQIIKTKFKTRQPFGRPIMNSDQRLEYPHLSDHRLQPREGIFSVWSDRQKQDWKFTKMFLFFSPSPQSMRKGGSSSGRLVEVPLGGWWWAGRGGLINLGCQLFFLLGSWSNDLGEIKII